MLYSKKAKARLKVDKKKKRIVPKTKLRFTELLGDLSISELAKEIGVTYTQLYPYKKKGANPTLLALEQLADGLSKLRNESVSVFDLLEGEEAKNPKDKKKIKKSAG